MTRVPTFLSAFAGIGGFDLGLERAGWRSVGQCEIDGFCTRVLKRHWPAVPRWGDIRHLGREREQHPGDRGRPGLAAAAERREWQPAGPHPGTIDLLCGGFPCQDLSVAGRRAGLAGARSGLFFELVRLARALQPRWLLLENVPGLLSSNGGRDFAIVLAALGDAGYGVAWRVLDARWFGVPQRRRRLFLVGCLGGPCPPAVLFESPSVSGHPAPGDETGADVAHCLGSGTQGGRTSDDPDRVSYALNARQQRLDGTVETFVVHADALGDLAGSLSENQRAELRLTPYSRQLTSGGGKPGQGYGAAMIGRAVRRLTPTECSRLQGFPDDWTCLCGVDPYSTWTCQCPDGPRYAALGNAVAVPVVEWIGRRLLRFRAHLVARSTR